MFRKIFVFAMLLAVLVVSSVQMTAAQTRDQRDPIDQSKTIVLPGFPASVRELPPQYRDYLFLVESEALRSLEDVHRAIPYRNSYMTPPPPPQKSEIEIIISAFTIVCVFDDRTGEWLYCDIYLG